MAEFENAYKITMTNEGGYANNKLDKGGETYKGIARNFWPNWAGWPTIDRVKATSSNLNADLDSNDTLEQLVHSFYKRNFWDTENLDNIRSQELANQAFDIAVNMGTSIAAKFLQKGYNAVHSETPLLIDGGIGPITVEAVNSSEPCPIYDAINVLRKERYDNIIASNPSQVIFKNSWYSRIKPFDDSLA
ncbi:hypothetical protein GS399_09900 [Pedobacter sp. HMF7647]|uniref:N-acetylmuramidase n=1 Tax=Hufsiella arboris TaxID=2695275 RepID=A0A7K1YA83_9SPHI|nr:glycosyl hydrolase 108 family protein [Hufsiella arboris]MXV51281.1 hypothetical protein [Hufsiella arboris]